MQTNLDTYKHQYLNGEIPKDKLKELLPEKEYSDFIETIEFTEQFKSISLNKAETFQKIQEKKQKKGKTRVIPLWKKVSSIAAAFFILALGGYIINQQWNNPTVNQIEYASNFNEQKTISLPDGSEVQLNAKSNLDFNEEDWHKNRTLNLSGEAFFKVKKGSKFTVNTDQGSVEVLGTQFNVNNRNHSLRVNCFEGKVRVNFKNQEYVLVQGKQFRSERAVKVNPFEIPENESPNWMLGKTKFFGESLANIIAELKLYHDFEIELEQDLNKELKFTGTIFHKDELQISLKTICDALNLKLLQKTDNKFIIKKS